MERINLILDDARYKDYLNKIEKYEKNREFCRHDINHFIDVARIGYILILERGLTHTKEEIYAAALLHDIGRWQQYEMQIPHHTASAQLAYDILEDCNFNEEEKKKIIFAISQHRDKINIEDSLSDILYKADKLSRACFMCKVEDQCYWEKHKKNLKISY